MMRIMKCESEGIELGRFYRIFCVFLLVMQRYIGLTWEEWREKLLGECCMV